MTITIGLAINEKIFVLSYQPIKRVKRPLMQRLKDKLTDIASSFMAPMIAYGVA